ncbi:hypothetical protein EGW08_007338 [Elysia chlorotica]|uniref:tRNA N(3)-cytidine methyltransferase METTL6 n=1 Tax=Elysia chlorotica TaxID=188477 RepID=A0A3S1BNF5_ELYCH|nr:hypothetical protein EGW08_007338 [Elysia chlorotica]
MAEKESYDVDEPFQVTECYARELNEEESQKLQADTKLVPEFKRNKLELEAQKNWDLFYKRNTTKFFKDRHWTKREFFELSECRSQTKHVIFEIGCGVGNFMFPLLEDDPSLTFYACDFSPRAVEFVKNHSSFDATRCTAFQCDITKDCIADNVPKESVDTATLIFVLSALHPDKMVAAVKNIAQVLKPGSAILVRDYGLYDHAMLRFAKGHKLGEHFYVRQDGTRAYYFSIEKLNSVMEAAGLRTERCVYIQRATVNKKEGVNVLRTFIQGKFVKTASDSESCGVEDGIADTLTSKCSGRNDVISAEKDSHKDKANSNACLNSSKAEENVR